MTESNSKSITGQKEHMWHNKEQLARGKRWTAAN